MKYDIAICIPSYNEENSICKTTEIIAEGLMKFFPEYTAIIINADNSSKDKTVENFLHAKTGVISKKTIINKEKGKGNNLLACMRFIKNNSINYCASFDADLKSIEPSWVLKMLTSVINRNVDFVSPIYKRNRYEGNATNHLCFPIYYALLKSPMRQPIAGDFAFNLKFVNLLLSKDYISQVKEYGIDIYMTFTAIIEDLKVEEVELTEKIHNPSFGKMLPIFLQEAAVLFWLINSNRDKIKKLASSKLPKLIRRKSIIESNIPIKSEDLEERIIMTKKILEDSLAGSPILRDFIVTAYSKLNKNKNYSKHDFNTLLSAACNKLLTGKRDLRFIEQITNEILGCYLVRVISYLDEVKYLTAEEVDLQIDSQSFDLATLFKLANFE